MNRFGGRWLRLLLLLATAVVITLFFGDMQIASVTTSAGSSRTAEGPHVGPNQPPAGDPLTVFVSGSPALARNLRGTLRAALEEHGIFFAEVLHPASLPAEFAAPFLFIRVDMESSSWTPFSARHSATATLYFVRDGVISREALAELPPPRFTDQGYLAVGQPLDLPCTAACPFGKAAAHIPPCARPTSAV